MVGPNTAVVSLQNGVDIEAESAAGLGTEHAVGGVAYLAVQRSPEYVPPAWPPVDGRQQRMMHVDVEVADLDAAVADAADMGATIADFQPHDDVRVMLDPAGHPFCLYLES